MQEPPAGEPRANELSTGAPPASAAVQAALDPRLTRLSGTVILARRRPVVGATVVVSMAGEPRRLYLTATDDRGDFRLEGLPEGTCRIEIRRGDLKPIAKDNVSLRGPFRAVVELTMEPLAAITGGTTQPPARSVPSATVNAAGTTRSSSTALHVTGRAVDRDSRPLEDVRLRWLVAGSGEDPRSSMSDEAGRFDLDALAAGLWRVEVTGTGFLPMRADVPLDRDTELTAVLVRQSAAYEPQPFDLMPREEPIPPPAAGAGSSAGLPAVPR